MRRGIIRIKQRRRKRQLRKLGSKLLRCRLMLEGVGIGDHHRMEVGVGLGGLHHRVRCCLLSNNSSGTNSNTHNNSDHPSNYNHNTRKVHLCNINPHPSNIKHHPHDPLLSNHRVINKYQADTLSSSNNRTVYLNKVINHLRSIRIKCSINSNKVHLLNNRGGQITDPNHLRYHSLKRQYLLLINLGIDLPKLLLRQNNQRITN